MTRHVITLAGAFVAVAALVLGSADAEARHCRSRYRNRCCQQVSNCGCQQAYNSGCQQGCNGGYFNGNQPQSAYPATAAACCTPQTTWSSVQPTSGTAQPMYNAPAPAGSPVPATTFVRPPAPSPGT